MDEGSPLPDTQKYKGRLCNLKGGWRVRHYSDCCEGVIKINRVFEQSPAVMNHLFEGPKAG